MTADCGCVVTVFSPELGTILLAHHSTPERDVPCHLYPSVLPDLCLTGLAPDQAYVHVLVEFVATEAEAIANFSHLFRRPEGIWLSPSDEEHMEQSLINGMDGQEFDLVVVSDGEAILGTSLTYGDLDSFSIEDPNRQHLLLNHISRGTNGSDRTGIGDQGSGAIGISRSAQIRLFRRSRANLIPRRRSILLKQRQGDDLHSRRRCRPCQNPACGPGCRDQQRGSLEG